VSGVDAVASITPGGTIGRPHRRASPSNEPVETQATPGTYVTNTTECKWCATPVRSAPASRTANILAEPAQIPSDRLLADVTGLVVHGVVKIFLALPGRERRPAGVDLPAATRPRTSKADRFDSA